MHEAKGRGKGTGRKRNFQFRRPIESAFRTETEFEPIDILCCERHKNDPISID